eukprot:TRINITY_DN10901_c0_g1_i1.p1 TRINITY_DN10901_c0_g1~~TRINITY_DN10901_c0_g1_i1.p1  ORF type:complete len:343 (+),score=108.17 TRINITY_DN10901_c0_g1_i1:90-1031(+)
MSNLPPMTPTEEKLRTMGVTMDQRKRLMMASKLGLGPLGQLGLPGAQRPSDSARSRSPPGSHRALPAPAGSSSSSADAARRRSTEQLERARALAEGGSTVKKLSQKVQQDKDDDADLDAFLAGGKKMAVAASKAKAAKQAAAALSAGATQAIAKSEQDRLHKEAEEATRKRKEEEERKKKEQERLEKEDEERRREERKRQREEEKRKKAEEKRRRREEEEEEEDYESGGEEDSNSEDLRRSGAGSLVKQAMKTDEKTRNHWGQSVKGMVSTDYKKMTDAELERRFSASSNHGEKLMSEKEVLAMLQKGGKKRK